MIFLEMYAAPAERPVPLPSPYRLVRWESPTPEAYLALYRQIGSPWCWWMRLEMPILSLGHLLADPDVVIHRLLGPRDEVLGFFELDLRNPTEPYLSYLGLDSAALGLGLGRPLLEAAIDLAWHRAPGVPPCRTLRVNTCTADHARALPAYRRAGFVAVSTVREIWNVPDDLGLTIPERLRCV